MGHRMLARAVAAAIATGLLLTAVPSWPQPAGRGQAAAVPAQTGAAPILRVAAGQVRGVLVGDVAVYRGVPFAAAPVGDLRWRSPQPVRPWQGVRDASTFSPSCTAPPNGSEDCLYLNVWRPAAARPGAKLPVMVWVHGGGFVNGSGALYDGTPFVKKGVVYVSINYRMGRAGWFAHPAITKNAPKGEAVDNFGLMDQIAALKWVQANIDAFGGDKANVTLFGESAGGVSSLYLITVEPARGLFRRVIAQSSFGLHPAFDARQSERLGADYFAKKGITGDSAATLAAMRKIPWADLQERTGVGDTQPIIDGKLIRQDSGAAFSQGTEIKVPLMLGGNSFEASLWPTRDPAARLAKLGPLPGQYDPAGTGDARRMINDMVTDYFIGGPDREIARWHVRNGAPAYRYYFSYLTPAQRTPQSNGVAHGGEIGYVFGRSTANPEDLATSDSMIAYWVAFAKHGEPGSAGGVAWPGYDLKNEPVLDFSSAGPVVRNHLFDERYDWVRDHREQIALSSDPGMAPLNNINPAHEGERMWVIPAR
jgi:para-nitrobenzyl esterase